MASATRTASTFALAQACRFWATSAGGRGRRSTWGRPARTSAGHATRARSIRTATSPGRNAKRYTPVGTAGGATRRLGSHGGSAAATGGAFYSSTSIPAEYQGAYFYADYALNFIRYLKVDANNALIGAPIEFESASNPVGARHGPRRQPVLRGHFHRRDPSYPLRGARAAASSATGTSYLSDLPWIEASNGWVPPRRT